MTTHEIPVTARPSKTDAAQMLRVDKSTLGRHASGAVDAGRSHHLTATAILDLNERFRRRRRDELAHEVIEYAVEREPDAVAQIKAEVVAWFEQFKGLPPSSQTASLEETVKSLSRTLDADQRVALTSVLERVARGERLTSFVSDAPDEY
jgi:hypothetical protein